MEAVREKKRTKKSSLQRSSQQTTTTTKELPPPVFPDDFAEPPSTEIIPPDVLSHSDGEYDTLESDAVYSEEKQPTQPHDESIDIEFISSSSLLPSPSAPPEIHTTHSPSTSTTTLRPDLSHLIAEQSSNLEQSPEHAPSAPELCDLDFYQIQQINRTLLNEIHTMESQPRLQPPAITLPPFTDQERHQYYFNPKLGCVLSFEQLGPRYYADQHDQMRRGPLYRELDAYYQLQSVIHNLHVDLAQLRESFPKLRKKIWTVHNTISTFSGRCDCNMLVTQSVSVSYRTGAYHDNWAASFKDSLTNYATICCATQRGKVILRDLQQLQISALVQEIVANSAVSPRRDELRVALTTLFHFAVKKTATRDFRERVKGWLERILVVFNRASLLDDQLFLVSHILRCPTEAALQVVKAVNIVPQPGRGVDAEAIDDWLALLWLALRPLRQWQRGGGGAATEDKAEKETNWAIVDSEGEDADEDGGEMRFPNEVVFLELLDRMPFRRIFQGALMNGQEGEVGESGDLQLVYLSGHRVLRLIIFSSAFVAVVTEGLASYQRERYKTFLKRLAGIVKWTAEIVTAIYDLYRSDESPKDPMILARLSTEYNMFIIRVTEHLLRNRSVLQYLSQLNYAHLDRNSYWMLNYYLLTAFPANPAQHYHEDFSSKMHHDFSYSSSHCTVSQWSAEELYFILETLSALAMGGGGRDPAFLDHIVQSLFHMGYVLDVVRERCYKAVRDLLVTITGRYSDTIEIILREIQANLSLITDQSLYLLKVLPFDNWRPSMATLTAIADMLENYPLDSVQHGVGKLLISYMNWGESAGDGPLILGHEYHCRAALVVLTATTKKFPRPESFKRVSLAGVDADPERRYIAWSWKMITKLKLHSMDQGGGARLQKVENNACQVIPAVKMEMIPALHRLVTVDRNPLAIYIALLMCDVGNVTEEVLRQGLSLLAALLESTPFFIITRCLELMVPLFLAAPDDLLKSPDCARIVDAVLVEERSLLSPLTGWRANEVVQQFAEMVTNQILEWHALGWDVCRRIVWLWLHLLTRNAAWSGNNNCLYVVDNVLRIAATIPGLLDACREYLLPLNVELKLKSVGVRKTFLPRNVTQFPWFSLVFIELDCHCYELVTNHWVKLIDRLEGEGAKRNVNQAVKELARVYGASELSVFRWAEFLLKLDRSSPVFSVALIQYWRLMRQGAVVAEFNPGLVGKLRMKLLAKEEGDTVGRSEGAARERRQSLFFNVAKGRTTTLENTLHGQNTFYLDYVTMASLREEVRQLADHWKLIAFRQDIKRRGTPSSTTTTRGITSPTIVPPKEKRLRILELIKSERDPVMFTAASVDVQVMEILRCAPKIGAYTKLLEAVTAEYSEALRLVDKQKQLEFQLYIQRLVRYIKTKQCPHCHRSISILVKYTELVKSSDNGCANMALLLALEVDDKAIRDEPLVHYFFAVLYNLRATAMKCAEGDHSACNATLENCLALCRRCDGAVMRQFDFLASIFSVIKERMRELMRRHCATHYADAIKVIGDNATMAPLLMEVLDTDQMDDGLYLRTAEKLMRIASNVRTLEQCLGMMKVAERASRDGVTESYRMSVVRFILTNLQKDKNAVFDLMAKELFIVMLRRIDLMPDIMALSFKSAHIQSTSHLLLVLFNVLGLANGGEVLRTDYKLSLDRLEQVEHLFTYEAVEAVVNHLSVAFKWPEMLPNEGVFVAFCLLLAWLLLRKNTVNGPERLHEAIVQLFKPLIAASRDNNCVKWRVAGLFQALRYMPEDKYLGRQFRGYLRSFSETGSGQVAPLDTHKLFVAEMRELPWNRFALTSDDLMEIYRVLRTQPNQREHTSLLQGMCAHVVGNVNWAEQMLLFFDGNLLNILFFVAVRVAYELPEGMTGELRKFYEAIEKLPWPRVDERVFSETLDWIVLSYPQRPFIPQLVGGGKTAEEGIFRLLLNGAMLINGGGAVEGGMQSWVDIKRRRLIAAMVRLFAMGANCEKGSVQGALRKFLKALGSQFSGPSTELEYYHSQLVGLLEEKAPSSPYLSVLQDHVRSSDSDAYISAFLRTLSTAEEVSRGKAKLFETTLRRYFEKCTGDDRNPWRTIEQIALPFVLKLRLDYLKDMELYLALHLFVTCNLRMCADNQKRVAFVDELLNWLPNIQFAEDNEGYLLLLWSQAVASAVDLHGRGAAGAAALLEKAQKYMKSTSAVRNAGWGKSLFNAIGLGKMQRQEVCVGYVIYLLVKGFPELRESSTESSVKFCQQFEADVKSSKSSPFHTELNLVFGSGQGLVVPERREEVNKALVQFMWRLNAQHANWFRNVDDFWVMAN